MIAKAQLQQHWHWVLAGCSVLLVATAITSLTFGAVTISFNDLWQALVLHNQPQTELIVTQLRIPRALLAMSIGALLASCGALTQGLFRNPLADPSLIGVTAGAAAGASAVIVLVNAEQWGLGGLSLVSLGAFAGGLLTVVLVYRLATGSTGTSVATMLLAGIAVTFLAGALANLLEFTADNEMLRRISLWRMGGLDAADYPRALLAIAVATAVLAVLPFHCHTLNALLLGESEARHLGINVQRVKLQLVVLVAAGVGTSVALAGTISFIGLVVPHVVRLCVGPNHRSVLPLSACLGALLLLLADAVARTVIAPTEAPVGLITALIGAPVFIALLKQRHHYGMQ